MTDGEIVAAIVASLGSAGAGVVALGRWFGTIWRDVRREEIAAARESAAAQRADANRTIEVQLEQAAATAALSARVDNIPSRVAELLWREHTPVEGVPIGDTRRAVTGGDPPSERRRMAAVEQQPIARFPGDRPPGRPGRRND